MKKFMVSILENIDPTLAAQMQPQENKIIGDWKEKGMVLSIFFRADGNGLFAVMQAASEDYILEQMKTLPFYSYMKISITEIR